MKRGVISIRTAVSFAWPTFKIHWRLFLGIMFLVLLAWAALEVVVITGQRFGILLWIAAHLAFLIFFAHLEAGLLRVCLLLRDNGEPAFADAFAVPLWLSTNFLVAEVLYLLIFAIGLALLIVPGIYFGARYAFFCYSLASGDPSIANAFRSAARVSASAIPPLSAILAGSLLFNLLGGAILGVGVLVTLPVSVLFLTDVYRQLCPSVPGEVEQLTALRVKG